MNKISKYPVTDPVTILTISINEAAYRSSKKSISRSVLVYSGCLAILASQQFNDGLCILQLVTVYI